MRFHCTALAAAALLATAVVASAQQAPASPTPGDANFNVFIRGTQVGREQVTLSRTASGWIITSTGRMAAPIDFTLTRFELKYGADWQPMEMALEARLKNAPVILKTSFTMTTAINEITQNNSTVSKEDQVSARTVVLPNNVFATYEGLAPRLSTLAADAEIPIYIAPQGEIKIKVRSVTAQTLTGPGGAIPTRRYELTFNNPGGAVDAAVVIDDKLRVVRFEIPAAGLLVVREDASSVAVRPEVARNPTDASVTIPANGFALAGTLTTPPGVAGRLRYPAIVLIGGATPADRDQIVGGVPVFATLARALADGGHVVLRYDRRGAGQSGGRTETATISDYADDAVSAVRWLAKRDDVDKKRIVVAGYGDGGAAALIAASRHKEIDGVVTLNAAGSRGADLILQQQQRVLDKLNLPPAERQARIDLQTKIQAAVIAGSGWEGVPPAMRKQADTPWFKSLLTYDPAPVMAKVKKPILIVHGDQDPSVPSSEADKLAALALTRKKLPPPDVMHIPDADQALSVTGALSPKVAEAIAAWIKKL
jgi:pimeloyl-ACP methyl ester carboxylesterase